MNVAMLVQGAASLSWLVAIVVVVLAVIRASRGQKVKGFGTLVVLMIVTAIVLTTVSAGLVFLQPEERGVVISAIAPNGYREAVLQPGLRWVIPFAENVVRYKISKQTYTMSNTPSEGQIQGDDSVTARTADGQEIFIDSSVIFAINPEKVIDVHIAWQDRYIDDLVRPLARGVIRDAVSQFGVEEVVSTKRYELRSQIEEALSTSLSENGLVLVDFVLRNITFSPEYAASVEQKQIAEQQAQQAKFVVEQKKQEAEQARESAKGQADAQVIKAQGEAQALVIQAQAEAEARLIQAKAEAQALELLAQAIQANPDVLTLEYIQKLAPGIQVMLVPSENPFLLPLPGLETTSQATPTPTAVPETP